MKSHDEIKKGLACASNCSDNIDGCKDCPYIGLDCPDLHPDAIALIRQLEAKNNVLYHTLIGVMHFVDKWLDDAGYDPESDASGSDAINRAAKAREIALKAIEDAENRPPF